jgi:hypothetical protein
MQANAASNVPNYFNRCGLQWVVVSLDERTKN